jgi:REP-associated tyrosine transposase
VGKGAKAPCPRASLVARIERSEIRDNLSAMVRYRRNLIEGGTFFLTATLADRTSSALTDYIALLRRAFRLTRREHPFTIDAVVVLPDHMHIIMTLPPEDANFPIRLSLIKRRFTGAIAKTGAKIARHPNREAALWQRRYWEHTIRDDVDFERHVDYVHFNPVKHGHVTRVSDWPYSSFHRFVQRGILPEDWAGDSSQTYASFGERKG